MRTALKLGVATIWIASAISLSGCMFDATGGGGSVDEVQGPVSRTESTGDVGSDPKYCDPALSNELECSGIRTEQVLPGQKDWQPEPTPGCPDCPTKLPQPSVSFTPSH